MASRHTAISSNSRFLSVSCSHFFVRDFFAQRIGNPSLIVVWSAFRKLSARDEVADPTSGLPVIRE